MINGKSEYLRNNHQGEPTTFVIDGEEMEKRAMQEKIREDIVLLKTMVRKEAFE